MEENPQPFLKYFMMVNPPNSYIMSAFQGEKGGNP
jgi:hypothetical protein